MNERSNRKAWVKPEVRQIESSDELLDLIARHARTKAPMPVKRVK